VAKRKIIWTYTAANQRREILRYWTERNKSTKYAQRLIELISEHLKIISINPEAFKESDILNIRVSSMGNFSIYYKLNENQIIVMAFWDNRQDPESLLKAIRKS
jgi:plasmid stabilization system protein ParE